MVHNDYTRTNGESVRITVAVISPTRAATTCFVNGKETRVQISKGKTATIAKRKALETAELWAWGDGLRKAEE